MAVCCELWWQPLASMILDVLISLESSTPKCNNMALGPLVLIRSDRPL
ncbi:hypothetical protein NC652_020803 [Populus alba x Populus x berolinensis]|nr:hypothetical protein NC652_020803 [Populus alba x Populus x berolinensis]